MFSARSGPDYSPNAIAEAVADARRAGRSLLDLTRSNPTELDLPYEADAIMAALSCSKSLVYDPAPFGIASARFAAASIWQARGHDVAPERVVLTASTSEAYSFVFKLLCDPGDVVVVPRPSYPLLEHLAQCENVRVRPYRLEYDGAWHIDFDSLKRACDSSARAIVVISPNNPTGSYSKLFELERLASLGLPIVSDEVFDAYALREDPNRATSALVCTDSLVFALDGLSKRAALPQVKVGFMAVGGPQRSVQEALRRLELIADTFLSVNASAQHALPPLLNHTRVTREAILRRVRRNMQELQSITANSAVTPLHSEGGWSAVLRLPALESETQWVLDLLRQDGVVVHPGWFYDFEREPFAIVSLLTQESVFSEGIRRLVARVH